MVSDDKAGAKVVAIQKADSETVYIFGFGTMIGEVMHPDLGFENPKIELDEGAGTVWGCECWWSTIPDEETWKEKYLNGRELKVVGAPA